jgi:hypothetical protein
MVAAPSEAFAQGKLDAATLHDSETRLTGVFPADWPVSQLWQPFGAGRPANRSAIQLTAASALSRPASRD